MEQQAISIFWHRRDLRLNDNAGLYHALKGPYPVLPLFIFDRNILDELEDRDDSRVHFIHQEIQRLQEELRALGSSMLVYYGKPAEVWPEILEKYSVKAVYTNTDYEPYAIRRDGQVKKVLDGRNIPFFDFKDHVIFEKEEVTKKDGGVYTVFTPYSRAWKAKLETNHAINGPEDLSYYFESFPNEEYQSNYYKTQPLDTPSLEAMNFRLGNIAFPDRTVTQGIIKNYDQTRNFPAQKGTSRLGIHFRFGTISIREKARRAAQLNGTFLNELIWRDFYAMILANFPKVVDRPFRDKYSFIPWRNNEEDFAAWCEGRTGYPIVDAGMRELNTTGYMHNRVRMITASFLTKHLLIDWRWGEAYFARKLLDFDLASNNGGWQWAAGTGTDAAPYFRIFNPYSQQDKFDKDFRYTKKYVPEYQSSSYPKPIVDHKMARERCLAAYKEGLARADEELGV